MSVKKSLVDLLQSQEEQKLVLKALREFNDLIAKQIETETDFTIKLEIRGDVGKVVHCKTEALVFDRPK